MTVLVTSAINLDDLIKQNEIVVKVNGVEVKDFNFGDYSTLHNDFRFDRPEIYPWARMIFGTLTMFFVLKDGWYVFETDYHLIEIQMPSEFYEDGPQALMIAEYRDWMNLNKPTILIYQLLVSNDVNQEILLKLKGGGWEKYSDYSDYSDYVRQALLYLTPRDDSAI